VHCRPSHDAGGRCSPWRRPGQDQPAGPAELVIDHSVQIDVFGTPLAFERNVELEYERNRERYQFLRWGQTAFEDFKVVPPGTGIVHQVNIERLARTVMTRPAGDTVLAYPDTCVGTDSHTTMVNGLGVLGWGVGGIEAEAAMLGQPVSMLIPRVVGFKLTGAAKPGVTATDVVLTITDMLRKHGVVGKFVEFYGEGCASVPLANRATIANMSPEFGSTCAIFPIDDKTIDYLRLTGRDDAAVALVETYAKEQGLWLDPAVEPRFSEKLELDLSTVVPSIAGPKRPQDRIELSKSKAAFASALPSYTSDPTKSVPVTMADGRSLRPQPRARVDRLDHLVHQHVQPVGDDRRRPRGSQGRRQGPHPQAVGQDVDGAGLEGRHGLLRGGRPVARPRGLASTSSATAARPASATPARWSRRSPRRSTPNDLAVTAVLSGNRNFEGRISPDVKMNYLASPPLVIAYALAGTMDFDFETERSGKDQAGKPVYLRDIWPTPEEVQALMDSSIKKELFTKDYADVFAGDERWQSLPTPEGKTFEWDADSTYVRKPTYFDGHEARADPGRRHRGARVLAKLGDSVTTDHISPAGSIKADSPAGQVPGRPRGRAQGLQLLRLTSRQPRGHDPRHLRQHPPAQPPARRCRGRVHRNFIGCDTCAAGEQTTIYDASAAYQALASRSSSWRARSTARARSRDWAAKGTALLGVKAVIAESYERIHRSNLIGMGVLPLQFPEGRRREPRS
jgi:aconitate hydratase